MTTTLYTYDVCRFISFKMDTTSFKNNAISSYSQSSMPPICSKRSNVCMCVWLPVLGRCLTATSRSPTDILPSLNAAPPSITCATTPISLVEILVAIER